MDLEQLRAYCLSRAGRVTEEMPFGVDTLVFKVEGKMFALTSLTEFPTSVNLKCDPAHALELRERYDAVRPGYHMNKKHWNTVVLDGSIADRDVRSMIDDSHALVVQSLPAALRARVASRR